MPAAVYVVAGRIDRRTGGSIYNRRMIDGLRALGWTMRVIELDGAFPEPDEGARTAAGAAFESIPGGSIVLVDGLALSALPDLAEAHRDRLGLVAVVHLPIAAAFGLDADRAARFAVEEARALAAARRVVVTGPGARPALVRYQIPADRVSTVEPGTDPAPLGDGSRDGTLRLLTVATVHAGKGHDVLITALAPLSDLNWDLTCAGSVTHDPRFIASLRELARRLQLADRVHFIGDLPAGQLDTCYAAADVFVLATQQETYGMAVAEALARGLPVVSTDTGAIRDLVGPDAGLVVPAGDNQALGEALRAVITSRDLRQQLAAGARRRRTRLPTWPEAAARMAAVLDGVIARG